VTSSANGFDGGGRKVVFGASGEGVGPDRAGSGGSVSSSASVSRLSEAKRTSRLIRACVRECIVTLSLSLLFFFKLKVVVVPIRVVRVLLKGREIRSPSKFAVSTIHLIRYKINQLLP